jgi:hypothetical protein
VVGPVAKAVVEPSLNQDKTSGVAQPVLVKETVPPVHILVFEILMAIAGGVVIVTVADGLTGDTQVPTIQVAI